ncbi:MAG: hypothetical protein H7282_02355 [Cytophagaceae bacterium]|nr:hypothetical protein [Cytophagaceae bacterium]
MNKYRALEIADAHYSNLPLLNKELAQRTQKLGKEQSSMLKSIKSSFRIPIKLTEKQTTR